MTDAVEPTNVSTAEEIEEENASKGVVTPHEKAGWATVEFLGEEFTLRYRAQEIELIEERTGWSFNEWFPSPDGKKPGKLGMKWLHASIMVGIAHEYAGATPAARKKKGRLTVDLVWDFINSSHVSNLLAGVANTVAMGLPGAADLIAEEAARQRARLEAADPDPLDSEKSEPETRTAA